MKIVATPDVAELVRREGGKLFVWTDPHRCCGGAITYLRTSSEPKDGRRFTPVAADGFELWFDPGSQAPPDELHLEVKGRRRKRVDAYWNGCAYAI